MVVDIVVDMVVLEEVLVGITKVLEDRNTGVSVAVAGRRKTLEAVEVMGGNRRMSEVEINGHRRMVGSNGDGKLGANFKNFIHCFTLP